MGEIPWAVVGPLIAALLAILAWLRHQDGKMSDLSDELSAIKAGREERCQAHGKTLDLVPGLVGDIREMRARQELYDQVLAPHLAGIIHSPVHRTRDELVDRLVEGSITEPEAMRLDCELSKMLDEEQNTDKRLAAALLLARVRWMLHDLNGTRLT